MPRIIDDSGWFKTTQHGGIWLNVKKMCEDQIRFFDVDVKVESLWKFLINANHNYNITGYIILVSNFGIVDGHDLIPKNNSAAQVKKQIRLYEFKDVYPYFYDTADTDGRLQTVFKLNLDKFEPILCDIKRHRK